MFYAGVTAGLSLLLIGAVVTSHKLKKRNEELESEQRRVCSMLHHLEQRYEKTCPPIAIATRYVLFSEFVTEDEELDLLDDLL